MECSVGTSFTKELQNPNNGGSERKPKIVVIMGPTGSGKSKLAIDLASHFPVEIINADSMQVYHSLDVLTNKVTLSEQKGVPHHLLGTISPNVEFTSKDFRDAAIPLIKDILFRNHLPIIVGGTNFYIQALVSPFLLDDAVEDMDDFCSRENSDVINWRERESFEQDSFDYTYDRLRALDPVAANRIHPNDHRKVVCARDELLMYDNFYWNCCLHRNNDVAITRLLTIRQYLEMYAHSGVLPSQLYQGKMTEIWGRHDVNSRYNCCFVCVDASLSVLDQFVEQRVDRMIEAGLLGEVYNIYNLNADYTRGLRQAIGVREFEDFLCALITEARKERNNSSEESASMKNDDISLGKNLVEVLSSSSDNPHKRVLEDSISKLKANTRRLVRRQKRRINRLQMLFGWNIRYVYSTESLLGSSEDTWNSQVVEPAAKVISSFLNSDEISVSDNANSMLVQKADNRDLWTQYICEECDKVLRGGHEWEQHKQGRGHRKRKAKLKKRQGSFSLPPSEGDHTDQ